MAIARANPGSASGANGSVPRRRFAGASSPPDVWSRYRDNVARHLLGISRDLQQRLLERLEKEHGYAGLRPSLGPLLSLVWLESRSIGSLAKQLGTTKQACSQLVNHAERSGYVERSTDPADGRSKRVSVTPLGRSLVGDAVTAILDCEERYAARVGRRPYKRFTAALARLFESWVGSPAATGLTSRARRTIGVLPLVAVRIQQDLMAATVACGHRGLKMSHAQVLPWIGPDGARAHTLARLQGVSRQAISATARDLEALGVVARQPDPRDGRGQLIRLTRRGERVLEDSIAALAGLEASFDALLGEDDRVAFARTARDLYRALRLEEEVFSRSRDASPGADRSAPIALLARRLRRELGEQGAAKLAALLEDEGGSLR